MIMLASVMDVEAFPWSADWFEQQARVLLGDGYVDENYRLWFMDNADHTEPRGDGATAHIVDYVGELQQALLDLDAWVADGIAPPASTTYVVTDDTQVELTGDAESRGGVQPLVSLAVSATCAADEDDVSIDVDAGEAVSFTVTAGVPEGVGEIVKVEWDWDGTGTFPDTSDLDQPSPNIELCESHTYTEPGTFFAVVRVTSERKGDPDVPYGLVQNLARVRIVVT